MADKKLKIGMLCYPTIGGSGLVATVLGTELARRGHELHFISYSSPFKLSQFERNISFHSVDPINYPLFNQSLYTFSLTAKVIEIVEEHKLDVVHAHYSIPHSLCAHLAREITGKNFRIVTTLHGTDVTLVGRDKPLYPINRYGIEKSDIVTTVSQFQRQYTLDTFGLNKPIRVIYNFIDTNVFRPDPAVPRRRSCLADEDEAILMHVSNYRQPKNVNGVIEIFSRVAKRIKARLVLVGDGPDLHEVKHRCSDLGLCNQITYLGQMNNVETVLPFADCIIQPSFNESFGMVLLEAMACEVPTVSSNVDGIPEVVVHGETGYMAGPTDYDALAEYAVAICQSPTLRQQLGRQGRERAIRHFQPDQIVPQYLDCYQQALAN